LNAGASGTRKDKIAMKQVCIIGLGQFGLHLARTLARMDCDVLAIDIEDAPVAAVRDDVQHALITDVRSLDALKSVVTDQIDEAIVALGESLEASILCTLHLKEIGVKHIRAKASTNDHARILKAVGADDVIFPEQETAERMAHRIVNPDLLDYLPLSKEYRVVEMGVPKSFVGKTLAQLHLRKKYAVLAIATRQSEKGPITFMPSADTTLPRGGTLIVIGKGDDIAQLREEE
jgi:trk system potassium uptake protein TrkA